MLYLLITSLIWALSFPIIKAYLSDFNPVLLSVFRFLIATLIFLPFAFKKISNKKIFIIIGAVQYGFMYIFYLSSFKYLKAYEIAILTTTTPLYILIINQLINKEKKYYLNAFFVVSACILFTYKSFPSSYIGVLLMQASNLCFALGQIFVIKYKGNNDDKTIVFYMYLGATILCIPLLAVFDIKMPTFKIQSILSLLYLSIIASGLGFYFWNKGINKVSIKHLAILNNLKIPLGVIFSVLILGEHVDFLKIIIGSILFLFAFY